MSTTQAGNARGLWPPPLAEALEARPGGDAHDLARQARQLTTA